MQRTAVDGSALPPRFDERPGIVYRLDRDDVLAARERPLAPARVDDTLVLLAAPHVQAKLVSPTRAAVRRTTPALVLADFFELGATFTLVTVTFLQRALYVRVETLETNINDLNPASGFIDFVLLDTFTDALDVRGDLIRATAQADTR